MRALTWQGTKKVSVEEVPDPTIVEPTDAIIRVPASCICGSDLWPYRGIAPAGIGTVTFNGSAGAYRDVSAWIEAVEDLTGFDASSLASATQEDVSATPPAGQTDGATSAGGGQGGGPVTFTTDASITDGVLSHRYDRKAG